MNAMLDSKSHSSYYTQKCILASLHTPGLGLVDFVDDAIAINNRRALATVFGQTTALHRFGLALGTRRAIFRLAIGILTCCFAFAVFAERVSGQGVSGQGVSGQPSLEQVASGQEPVSTNKIIFAKSLNSLIRSITETVLESHIEPPTRQQMVLDVIRHIAKANAKAVSPDLATAVSDTNDLEQLYQLLASEITKLGVTETNSTVQLNVVEAAFQASIHDGFNIISKSNARAEEQLASNRYVGIGVQLGSPKEGGGHRFLNVIADGPAEVAGILKNDVLEAIDGRSIRSDSLEDVIALLRGLEATTVTLTVRTNWMPARKLTLVRRVVPIQSAQLVDSNHQDGALHIKFDKITASSLNELQKIVAKSEEGRNTVRTMVLDLRNTNVTSLHYLHLFADAFLDEMSLGQIQSRGGIRNLKTEDGKLLGETKIATLVSPGHSDEIDLLALALHEAGLNVISDPNIVLEKGWQPNAQSRDAIPLVGTDYFIQIATNRVLTNAGNQIGPETLTKVPKLQPFQTLNNVLQNGSSDLNRVLRSMED